MPDNTFPWRRVLTIDPIIVPATPTPTAVAVDSNALKLSGVRSFKLQNPNPFWIWFRGWSGLIADMPTITGKGHLMAPGSTEVMTSQYPQWVAAQAVAMPGFPVLDGGGAVLYPSAFCVLTYGGGA